MSKGVNKSKDDNTPSLPTIPLQVVKNPLFRGNFAEGRSPFERFFTGIEIFPLNVYLLKTTIRLHTKIRVHSICFWTFVKNNII